jgi:hypothetical protein
MSERESETREQTDDEDKRERGGCADSDRSKGIDGDPWEVEQEESPVDDWLDPSDAALAGDSTKTGKP